MVLKFYEIEAKEEQKFFLIDSSQINRSFINLIETFDSSF